MIIAAEGLEKSFSLNDIGKAKQRVLRGLSFSVKEGEIVGLVGLNGQGKSTTIKIMLGLLYPDEGQISVFGFSPGDLRAKRKLSYLPENPSFFENLNALEILHFVGRLRKIEGKTLKDEIERLLNTVGLSGNERKTIRKYSKGMVQRLGLAQAFIGNPELVILDEPLSGLDPLGRKMAKQLIMEHRNSGGTVFFTSHILEDIESMCDRILILNRGRIIKEVDKTMLYKRRLEDIFVEAISDDKNNLSHP